MSQFSLISLCKALFLLLLSLKNCYASEILEVDSDTLGELINSQETVLLEFYAPWCEHCKNFESHFEKLHERIQNMDENIFLARINAEENKNVAKFFDIQGYPSIILFVNGDPIFYNNDLTYEAVFDWMNDALIREPAEISTDEGFDSLSENLETIHVFAGEYTHPNYHHVRVAAKKLGDVPVFTTTLDHVYKQYNIVEGDFITISFKKNETILYSGDFNSEALKNFVYISQMGHLIKFDQSKLAELFRKKLPILCLFGEKDDHTLEKWVDGLRHGY